MILWARWEIPLRSDNWTVGGAGRAKVASFMSGSWYQLPSLVPWFSFLLQRPRPAYLNGQGSAPREQRVATVY